MPDNISVTLPLEPILAAVDETFKRLMGAPGYSNGRGGEGYLIVARLVEDEVRRAIPVDAILAKVRECQIKVLPGLVEELTREAVRKHVAAAVADMKKAGVFAIQAKLALEEAARG